MELLGFARIIKRKLYRLRRSGPNQKLVADYLARPGSHKLHIGCGFHELPGWLNTDYYPSSSSVVHLDATRKFPFADASFDFIFSEHMIEHVPYVDGCAMLEECFRVLKPGGVVRISTPDLKFLIGLYESKAGLHQDYFEWSKQAYELWPMKANDTLIINNFMRNWGHCFIYDEKALREAMENSGFQGVLRCEIQRSCYEELRDLENESRMPSGYLRLETMTVEASRPVVAH